MSTTVVDTDSSIPSKILQRATKESSAIGAKRLPILPTMVLAMGLLASLAWGGFVVWAVLRIVRIIVTLL
jgi:hypothetical protein